MDVDILVAGTKNVIQRLCDRAEYDMQLRNALKTSKNNNAITMGNWTMIVNDTIDIIGIGETVAKNINLYNIAVLILEKLNDNISPASLEIRELIDIDAKYGRLVQDIKIYEVKMEEYYSKKQGIKAAILEDRLDDSIRQRDLILIEFT